MSNKRIRFNAYFSVQENLRQTVSDYIGHELSKKFAGATITTAIGYWAKDGADFKNKYAGPILNESILSLDLSVTPEREYEALDLIRKTIAQAITDFKVDAQHIHIESYPTVAFHTIIPEK